MANRWGNSGNSDRLYILGLQNLMMEVLPWNIKMLTPWEESYDQSRQHIKKQRHHFVQKGPSSPGYGFSNIHVCMWILVIKKAERWRIGAFELWLWRRLLRVPWTARRSNQSILRKLILGVHWKDWCWSWNCSINCSILATWCEDPDVGRDWGQEEKGTTEHEMVRRHHQLNGHEFV